MNPGTDRTRTAFRSGPSLWAAACGAALALAACEERMAGTSVGTGNPTEIEVAFKDDSGEPVPVTGSLQVYASTQIPVPGFRPQPLVSIEVSGATTASLKAEDLAGLPDSVWAPGSAKDGIYDFNLVVSGRTQGAILKGYSFRKSSARFLLGDEAGDGVGAGGLVMIEGKVAPLVDIACTLDTNTLNGDKDNYLFVYGSGYVAKGEGGLFKLVSVPESEYEAFFVSLPRKGSGTGGTSDSSFVYGLNAAILPDGQNPLQMGAIHSVVALPDSLKASASP